VDGYQVSSGDLVLQRENSIIMEQDGMRKYFFICDDQVSKLEWLVWLNQSSTSRPSSEALGLPGSPNTAKTAGSASRSSQGAGTLQDSLPGGSRRFTSDDSLTGGEIY